MLTDLKTILDIGCKGGFAVPAFDVYNLETAYGVMQAAEEMSSPVIFQVYTRLFDTDLGKILMPSILKMADSMKVPAAVHLDHGAGDKEVDAAIENGATGVMIDASTLPMEENISIVRRTVEKAAKKNIGVEGELGHVGSAAKGDETGLQYTDVEDARSFAEETGVTALAVAVGTAHGHYKKAPVLAIDRIRDISQITGIPLVLHGGSGVPDDQIKAAIRAGIRKINFATDLCCAFINGIEKADPSLAAIDLYMQKPTEYVKQFAIEKIKLTGDALL